MCAIGGRFPGTTALGPVPPLEIPVSFLSQCQSHWLTWTLSLLCSTASSWYMPTNIQYVLHQLMFSLQSDCLYFIPSGTEKRSGEGETVRNVLTCHRGGVKNDVPLMPWWSVSTSAALRVSVSFYSFVVGGIWLYCKLSQQARPVWILSQPFQVGDSFWQFWILVVVPSGVK